MRTMKSISHTIGISAVMVLLFASASMTFQSCHKVNNEPCLIVSADTLVFKGNETLSLFVTTNNPERREFYVDVPYSWISVYPQSGRIAEGETVELKVTSYSYDYTTFNEDFLYLSSAYDQKAVKLIGLPEDYASYTLPETLYIPQDVDNVNMRISNYGNTTLNYAITASTTSVSCSPASGHVGLMQHADINVTVDREALLSNPFPKLFVSIDDVVDTVLIVPEQKLMLPNDVVDAEYAKATDMLVYVATNSTLNIYHPDTKALSTIALNYVPTCVSISPDGTKAVAGHNAHVTYVDLMAETVLTVNNVSCDAIDIVLTDDGWTYVFPRRDQWEHIRCINVSTDNALESQSSHLLYAGSKGKLHPSGKYLYATENLSSYDIEKYDIQEGTAVYLYDSYTGDYTSGGDLWFEENGERVFTRSGNVFKTNEVQSLDLMYNGSITLESNYNSIRWVDHLALNNELYVLQQVNNWNNDDNPPYVYVYNADNLSYKTKMRVEDFSVEQGDTYSIYNAIPNFVFANSNGTELYVVTKAKGSGLLHEWAIQTLYRE